MTHKSYAGIGARKSPPDVLQRMTAIASLLSASGYTLRSGLCQEGADKAFENGCNGQAEYFTPLNATRNPHWFQHARRYHPVFDELGRGSQQLIARNSPIVLGADLKTPVRFIVCWTPGGEIVGGTGQALRIATDYSIPVFNLAVDGAERAMWGAL